MHPKTNPGAVADAGADMSPGEGGLTATLAQHPDMETACEAYVVLVSTPAGHYRRRVFLSLHSATAAVQRALAKNQPVRMVLCQLAQAVHGGRI